MIKLNWGNSLLIFFICYVGTLACVLYQSTQVDHTLVMDNYYDHDLAYQKRYDQIANRDKLTKDLDISFDGQSSTLALDFGTEQPSIKGQLFLYSPSDRLKDKQWNFSTSQTGLKTFDLQNIQSGKYTLQIEWEDSNRSYYKEDNLFIP